MENVPHYIRRMEIVILCGEESPAVSATRYAAKP